MSELLTVRAMKELRKQLKAGAAQTVAVMEAAMQEAARLRNSPDARRYYTPEGLEQRAREQLARAREEVVRLWERYRPAGGVLTALEAARRARERAEKAVQARAWLDPNRYERVTRELAPAVTGLPTRQLLELYRKRAEDPEAKAYLEEVLRARIDAEGAPEDLQALFEAARLEALRRAAPAEREAHQVLELASRRAEYAGFVERFVEAAEREGLAGAGSLSEANEAHHFALLLAHWFDREEQEEQAAAPAEAS